MPAGIADASQTVSALYLTNPYTLLGRLLECMLDTARQLVM